MRERIVDIVVWAVALLQQDKFDKSQLDFLERKGFTEKEISIAFSWLSDKFNSQAPNELILSIANPPQSFRIFTDEEKDFFTEEAYNNIVKLLSVGVIRHYHIDMIVEKAESLGLYKINSSMVSQFVAYFIFDIPTPDENLIRFNFCGNESIN